ncbi:hypothetical protein D3C76_1190610 [compost metagenome]
MVKLDPIASILLPILVIRFVISLFQFALTFLLQVLKVVWAFLVNVPMPDVMLSQVFLKFVVKVVPRLVTVVANAVAKAVIVVLALPEKVFRFDCKLSVILFHLAVALVAKLVTVAVISVPNFLNRFPAAVANAVTVTTTDAVHLLNCPMVSVDNLLNHA